jgi:hypothetical protein
MDGCEYPTETGYNHPGLAEPYVGSIEVPRMMM